MILKDVFTNLGPRLLANQVSLHSVASVYCIVIVFSFRRYGSHSHIAV